MSAQECYRFSYLQHRKRARTDTVYHIAEMRVDYDGKTAFYYSEPSYKKDSLDIIAFDNSGNIADENAYGERARLLPWATNDKNVIDFSKQEMSQYYNDLSYFDATMPLELPQWTVTGKDMDVLGYKCSKATGTYLGREWTIWYTDEIPVNVGPWFLWGAPGLIIQATDSENDFLFKLLGVEKIQESRLEKDMSYRKIRESYPRITVYSMSMKEMEKLHSRYLRDRDFFNSLNGISNVYIEDQKGNRTPEAKTMPYIPYIPDEYWKTK